MKIQMEVKYRPEPYWSRSFFIELGPEDVGLEPPTDKDSFNRILTELQVQAKKSVELFLLKEGVVDKETVVERILTFKGSSGQSPS